MAKTLVTYRLYPFDNVRAAAGALCVMVPSSYDGTITVGNTEVDGIKNIDLNNDGTYSSDNTDFLGAGICRYKAPNNYFFSVNSITYTFNERGTAISLNAKGKILKLAEQVNLTLTASGSVVGNAYPTTRGGTSGENTASTDYNSVGTVLVDTLNARDEFAAQALRGMLAHINDPSTLSDNEIAFYCEEAYRWAASMMLSAANRRANGYENTTDTALGQIATAVSQGSQNTIGMSTVQNSRLTVSPASVTGTGTFTLGVDNGYIIPASSDAQHWQSAWTFTNSSGINNGTITLGNNSITPLTSNSMWTDLTTATADTTHKIDVSHLPDSILKWSDLINSGNSEKINNVHLNISSDNNVANKIPVINSGGVMEIGTCMDFHDLRENNTNATDYNTRLQMGNPSLNNGKGNTVTLPNNSGTLALVENTVSTSTTWWGRPISDGKVEGDIKNANHIYMSGNLDIVGQSGTSFTIGYSDFTSSQTPPYRTLLGVHSLAHSDPALYIGYGLKYDKRLELHGRKIQFIVQKSTATDYDEDPSTAMTILGRENAGKEGYVGIGIGNPTSMLHVAGAVRIGDILLTSEGNKLKISRYDGTAADVYSTGGVTALGIPSSNSGTVDNVSTKQLNIVGDSNTAKLSVVGSELRVTINNTTYRVNLTQIS